MSKVFRTENEILVICDCGLTHKITKQNDKLKIQTLIDKVNYEKQKNERKSGSEAGSEAGNERGTEDRSEAGSENEKNDWIF